MGGANSAVGEGCPGREGVMEEVMLQVTEVLRFTKKMWRRGASHTRCAPDTAGQLARTEPSDVVIA